MGRLNCYDNGHTYNVGDNTCTQVADVHIKMGSDDITGQTKNVIVGQQIPLLVEVVGTTEEVSNIQWSVPGNRVASYTANSTSGSADSSPNMQSNPLTIYWVDGGDNREVTLGCRIGTTQFDKHATFNVKRPTASVTTSTDSVVPDQLGQRVRFGHFPPPGITFTPSVTVPQGFTNGLTQWVQVVAPLRRRKTNTGVWQRWTGDGLDSAYPYWGSGATNDSPSTPLDTANNDNKVIVEKTIDDHFVMYLMFKPDGANSIWVPLRKVSWFWAVDATFDQTTIVVVSSSHSTNPASEDCVDHPQWTRNAASNTWVNE